jgi:replication fork protection complex subunit Tof1/Swi1
MDELEYSWYQQDLLTDLQLGGSSANEDGHYVLGDDALACLRDLKRWLKLYDEKTNRLDVARCLAEAKLVNGDLLPILASWPENESSDKLKSRVALACLELLVPLTWPLENGGEMTLNHHRHTPYIQQAQVLYKAGILTHDTCSILRQIVRISLPSIAMSRDDRTNRDEGIIKLVLYFLRNITVIRQIPNLRTQGLDNEVSRSTTIEAFREQDVFALLLTVCSNMGEDFNLHDVIVLEILFNLVKGVEVEKLWMTEDQRKGQDVSDLKAALTVEKGWQRDYKRNGPSRHGRFGTMIWVKREDEKMSAVSGQDTLRDGRNALFNMDKSKKWSKPQQKQKDIEHTMYDFNRSTRLNPSATELLRNFVEEFLDSGFNPLFTHLRKAIERESERILDINYRQFFYTVSWFLQAERVRRDRQKKDEKIAKITTDFEAESYALVAAVLNQETFITLNRYMQTSYDNKEWQDLNASMRCFTQILLTVQEMAQSPLEEDQEIADNIQNRIFYEETTHDRIVAILKGYKDQGFGYLDACTELSHVFLRMLERYSKENADLQIRSRRRARRRRKEQNKKSNENGENGEEDDEQSENEDIVDVAQVSKERKFDFNRFAAKFTSQSSVNTFIAFTAFYRDLSVEQIKRAHRFFYRVAFKQQLAVLLYRVDIVALFYKMIKGPEGLEVSHAMYKEWSELTKQVFKKMFKKLEQRPELVVELLFSKINATLYYLEYGQEKQTTAFARAPAELEVRPALGRDKKEMLGIVTAALQNDEKVHLVQWVRMELEKAWDEKRGWEAEAEARKEMSAGGTLEQGGEQPSREDVVEKSSYITVQPMDDEVRTAMFKNGRLRLLMKLVGFERLGDEDVIGATWVVPSALTASDLEQTKKILEEFEFTPWKADHEEDTPESLIRRVKNISSKEDEDDVRRDAFIDDSEGDDDGLEEFLFPDNIRSKSTAARDVIEELKEKRRKRKREAEPLDDETLERRQKARQEAALERRRKIKSDLYIHDSDDESDAEKDREFFKREEEVRRRQEERIRHAMKVGAARTEAESGSENRKKRKPNAKNKAAPNKRKKDDEEAISSDDDLLMLSGDESASSQLRRASGTEDEAELDDTPLSSQSSAGKAPAERVEIGRKELAQSRTGSLFEAKGTEVEADDDEEDLPVSTARQRYRGGFIIDSDDDD